jgi:hypothetical protein
VNFRNKITAQNVILGLPAGDVTAVIADCNWLIHVLQAGLSYMRSSTEGYTQYMTVIQMGTTGSALGLPEFVWPAPPPGTVPVAPGALRRIFAFVDDVKKAAAYTTAIGEELQIIGSEVNPDDHPVPKFKTKVEDGPGGIEVVQFSIFKYTHQGTATQSKRGGGPWEDIAVTTARTLVDERPLLVANTPEVREYRMRYWDKGTPNDPWTDVAKETVGPA